MPAPSQPTGRYGDAASDLDKAEFAAEEEYPEMLVPVLHVEIGWPGIVVRDGGCSIGWSAEAVFKHYSVHIDQRLDDNCFQDLTCFRGRTDEGEQILILKTGDAIELHVRKLRPGE